MRLAGTLMRPPCSAPDKAGCQKDSAVLHRTDVHPSRLSAARSGLDGAKGSGWRGGVLLVLHHRGGPLRRRWRLASPGVASRSPHVAWHAPPQLAKGGSALWQRHLPQLADRCSLFKTAPTSMVALYLSMLCLCCRFSSTDPSVGCHRAVRQWSRATLCPEREERGT